MLIQSPSKSFINNIVAYTPLKDLYADQVMYKPVPPLPRQVVRSLVEQTLEMPSLTGASTDNVPAPAPEVQVTNFNPDQVTDWITWNSVDVPQKLFELTIGSTGEGRGEYSVASFLSGLKSRKEIDSENIVQGGNISFDVAYGNREYEVKELDADGELDVRIGAEGVDTANTLKEGLITAAKIIRKLYSSLTKNTQEEINILLKKKFNREKFNLGVYLSKFSEGKLYELPEGLLGGPGTFVRKHRTSNWSMEPSILTAVNSILELQDSQSMANAPGTKNSRVQALLDLISKKEMYGVEGEDETTANFYKEVEKDLESLDRDLVSKRCEFSQEEKYCTTLDTFIQEIKSRNLQEDIQNLITNFRNDVLGIFPKESTFAGLFIVDSNKFKYIPKSQLTEFIENYRLSFGKPKIRLKR